MPQQRTSDPLKAGALLNVFGFLSGLRLEAALTSLTSYSLLYILKRKDFRKVLKPSQAAAFGTLFEEAASFANPLVALEPIGLYAESLRKGSSDVLLMDPERQSNYVQAILGRKDSSRTQRRTLCQRKELSAARRVGVSRKGRVNVGVQCSEDFSLDCDVLLILEE